MARTLPRLIPACAGMTQEGVSRHCAGRQPFTGLPWRASVDIPWDATYFLNIGRMVLDTSVIVAALRSNRGAHKRRTHPTPRQCQGHEIDT